MRFKRLLLTSLTSRPFARLAPAVLHGAMPIFYLHRFAHPDFGVSGESADCLRASLAYLRAEGFQPGSIADLAAGRSSIGEGKVPVAFTVDDGYSDFADIALPVFAEFDWPVTVFVSTGVIDRTCWYWWDNVRFLFERSARDRFEVRVGNASLHFDLTSPAERERQLLDLVERMKVLPETARQQLCDELSVTLEVTFPAVPPPAYTALSWQEIRACASGGIASFAPHTITHAALPMTTDVQARDEIVGSWIRLREQLPSAVPVFCYPFGAYTAREVEILRGTEMVGALTTVPGYASRSPFMQGHRGRYEIPRFGYSVQAMGFQQVVIGLERVKMALRRGRVGQPTGAPTSLPDAAA